MQKRRVVKRFGKNVLSVLAGLTVVAGAQSFFGIPLVYTVSAISFIMLAHSLVSAQSRRGFSGEYAFFVFWAIFLGLYDPPRSAGLVGVYMGARLLCEVVSFFISHVDKVFGVLTVYCFGSILLLSAFIVILDVRWWIVGAVAAAVLGVQWFVYRRYDFFRVNGERL